MHPTARLAAVHRPLIRFLGKRSWPTSTRIPGRIIARQPNGLIAPTEQRAHPAAPEELKRSFADFLRKFQSPVRMNGNGSSSSMHVYQEYWEAPSRYWDSRVKTISEEEIGAVLVSVSLPFTLLPCSQILSRAEEQRCIRLYIQPTCTPL